MEDRPSLQSAGTGIVERAKSILMQPKAEWPRIASETTEPSKVLTGYALPLMAIGPIAGLIGGQLFGIGTLGVSYTPSLGLALTSAVVGFVLAVVSLFVVSWVANFLSPKFGGKDSYPAAFRLIAYSMTAAWVASIFGLVPSLAAIGLLGSLYSVYLIYAGATPVMGVPQDKAVGYTVATIAAAIVMYLVVAAIAAAITASMIVSSAVAAAPETATIDMGELGKVEVNGNTATVTVDGQEVEVTVPEG